MNSYIIMTDSASDLPEDYIQENNLVVLPLYYNINGQTYGKDKVMESHLFYEAMRQGMMPTTNAVVPEIAMEVMEQYLEDGQDILFLAFSSGLSSTFQNIKIATGELSNKYPNRKILVIDTLCASLGQGLLVHKALQLKKLKKTIEETAIEIKKMIPCLCHFFTVDDLHHLQRGGRVSKTTAVVGTMLQVKPILHVDDAGCLIKIGTVRGRKKSLNDLVTRACALAKNSSYDNDIFFISHGDCEEDAKYVAKKIQEATGIKEYMIAPVGPVIGSHSGPGTIALFLMGQNRG